MTSYRNSGFTHYIKMVDLSIVFCKRLPEGNRYNLMIPSGKRLLNGLVCWGNLNRKPWFLPSNIGISCKFSHHPNSMIYSLRT